MIRMFAHVWAKWSYVFRKYSESSMHELSARVAELSLSVKALKGVAQSTFTPSIASENRFLPQYMAFSMAPTTAGLSKVFAATGTAASTVHVTGLSISTSLLQVGMTVVGTNIPAGTTVASIVSATAFDLSQASTGAASDLTFGSLAATGTASSTIHVTACSINPQTKLQVGMTVTGANIPAGTTVAAIVSATVAVAGRTANGPTMRLWERFTDAAAPEAG